jgi:hypothetical protein
LSNCSGGAAHSLQNSVLHADPMERNEAVNELVNALNAVNA